MPSIHPTALIDPGAEVARDVEVGAFAIVEAGVKIASGVRIEPHAQVLCGSDIGTGTVVGRGAIIGGLPQDLSFNPDTPSGVIIGEQNILREHVTIHRASKAEAHTVVGSHNYLMVGAHLGHDVNMGDHNILANAVLVAGHVKIGSHTVIGGGAVFHQFLRLGDYCMVQGNGSFSKDIPPFAMALRTNLLAGLNALGLRRAGFNPSDRAELKQLFELLWRDGKNLTQAIAEAREKTWGAAGESLLGFLAAPTKKGVCGMRNEGRASQGTADF
ncbi:MAG: acyl-ACP--UDP-N-acetylglucosamine O-acyltransferase [Verrucomicrobiales bacterium]